MPLLLFVHVVQLRNEVEKEAGAGRATEVVKSHTENMQYALYKKLKVLCKTRSNAATMVEIMLQHNRTQTINCYLFFHFKCLYLIAIYIFVLSFFSQNVKVSL